MAFQMYFSNLSWVFVVCVVLRTSELRTRAQNTWTIFLFACGKVVRTLRCPLSALMRWGQGRCAALPRGLCDRGRETRGFFFVLALPGERCSSVLRLASMDESESESESSSRLDSDRNLCLHFHKSVGSASLPCHSGPTFCVSRRSPRIFCRWYHGACKDADDEACCLFLPRTWVIASRCNLNPSAPISSF